MEEYNEYELQGKHKKFNINIYNDKHLFKYYNSLYLIYYNYSCWIDCFIILYIFIYKKNVKDIIMNFNDADLNINIKNLNGFTDIIIQTNRTVPIKFFDLYIQYTNNLKTNFLYLDRNKIGLFNSIDLPYNIFDDNILFCIKCHENCVCTGQCKYSKGEYNIHYCSPVLSIPIDKLNEDKYANPMNLIFDLYFASVKRLCEDIRCKNGIISHCNTTYYNNFEFPDFLIFVVDTYDVKTLKDNGKKIKTLFNKLLILDMVEYNIVAYYLMPYENHFVIIFRSQISDEIIKLDRWYLFDDLEYAIFEKIGVINKILDEFAINAIFYKKNYQSFN